MFIPTYRTHLSFQTNDIIQRIQTNLIVEYCELESFAMWHSFWVPQICLCLSRQTLSDCHFSSFSSCWWPPTLAICNRTFHLNSHMFESIVTGFMASSTCTRNPVIWCREEGENCGECFELCHILWSCRESCWEHHFHWHRLHFAAADTPASPSWFPPLFSLLIRLDLYLLLQKNCLSDDCFSWPARQLHDLIQTSPHKLEPV